MKKGVYTPLSLCLWLNFELPDHALIASFAKVEAISSAVLFGKITPCLFCMEIIRALQGDLPAAAVANDLGKLFFFPACRLIFSHTLLSPLRLLSLLPVLFGYKHSIAFFCRKSKRETLGIAPTLFLGKKRLYA